ncbi:MAG: zinc ABC transporter substrate-binding protein [Alphaproteobacteria bacterium]
MTSILPLHGLVAGVMNGVGSPTLLVEDGGSPHGYALRPSQARTLAEADAVFWIGSGMEGFLTEPLAALAGDAAVLAMTDAPGIVPLPVREGGLWEAHDHAAGEEDGDAHGEGDHGDAAHDEDGEELIDHHLWLDPDNAIAMVAAVADTLGAIDPANAEAYAANAEALQLRIGALDAALAARFASLRDRPYVVFHDAFQYLEAHYGLSPVGSVTVSPEAPVSAARLAEIEARIRATGAVCVFAEPQFRPALIETIVADTGVRAGTLDPLGVAGGDAQEDYFALMNGLADSLAGCLGG